MTWKGAPRAAPGQRLNPYPLCFQHAPVTRVTVQVAGNAGQWDRKIRVVAPVTSRTRPWPLQPTRTEYRTRQEARDPGVRPGQNPWPRTRAGSRKRPPNTAKTQAPIRPLSPYCQWVECYTRDTRHNLRTGVGKLPQNGSLTSPCLTLCASSDL